MKKIRQRSTLHAGLGLANFTMYWLYYLFRVRISGLRPFTSATVWGLPYYLVVAFTEEIYFRGLWYHLFEKRLSGRAAILLSGLLFGLVHFSQGKGLLPNGTWRVSLTNDEVIKMGVSQVKAPIGPECTPLPSRMALLIGPVRGQKDMRRARLLQQTGPTKFSRISCD